VVAVADELDRGVGVAQQGTHGPRRAALEAAHGVEQMGRPGAPAGGPDRVQEGLDGRGVGARVPDVQAHAGRRPGGDRCEHPRHLRRHRGEPHDAQRQDLRNPLGRRVDGEGRLGPQAPRADERPLQVRPEDGRLVVGRRGGDRGDAAQGGEDVVPRRGQRRRQQGRGPVAQVVPRQGAHTLLAIHRVAAAAAVDVLVDEPGRDDRRRRTADAVVKLHRQDALAEAHARRHEPSGRQHAPCDQAFARRRAAARAHADHGFTTIWPSCRTAISGVLRTASAASGSPIASAPAMRTCGDRMRSA